MSNATPEQALFNRFRELASRLNDCGACVQNSWSELDDAGKDSLRRDAYEACKRLDDLADEVQGLGFRLRRLADRLKTANTTGS